MCYVFKNIAMTSLCCNNHIDILWSGLDDGKKFYIKVFLIKILWILAYLELMSKLSIVDEGEYSSPIKEYIVPM